MALRQREALEAVRNLPEDRFLPKSTATAVCLGALLLAGCGTTIVKTVQAGHASHPPKPKLLRIGDSATLNGEREGERLRVTLLGFLPHVVGGQFDEPKAGNEYVGVDVRLTNTGTLAYSDSPSNGATIITSTGRPGESAILGEGECSGSFATSVKITPGESEEGCLPAEIPDDSSAARFQFTLDSGFGEETAEWDLNKSPEPAPSTKVAPVAPSESTQHGVTRTQVEVLEGIASSEESGGFKTKEGDRLSNVRIAGEWAAATWAGAQPETIIFRKTGETYKGNELWRVVSFGSSPQIEGIPPSTRQALGLA